MTKRLSLFLFSLVAILTACQTEESDPSAAADRTVVEAPDFVLVDATIYTVDDTMPVVEAMAIVDGRIARTGSKEEILSSFPDLPSVSAGGATVIPGLIDSHAHVINLAELYLKANLVGTTSIPDVISRLKEFEQQLPDSAWLVGRGWDQNDWPSKEFPSRYDLDSAFPDRPVFLERIDGHAQWANSVAIRAAGEDSIRTSEDPPGGIVHRAADGTPTGIFVDDAQFIIRSLIPGYSETELRAALEMALAELSRNGLTGVHEAGAPKEWLDRFKRAVDDGVFNVRMYAMVDSLGPAFDEYCNNHLINYGDRLTVRSVKKYIDGALGSRGARLIEPYSDEPGHRGVFLTKPDDFPRQVRESIACGYQVNSHAIGDGANRLVLDAYEAAGATPSERPRIEHAQVVATEDIDRFKNLGVIAAMQPTHATSDMYWAEDRVGPHRIRGGYAWRSFMNAGVPLAFGSDFPVEQVNPLLGFYSAVTRQDETSWPEGGWYPDERLSREETLKAFTIGNAYAAFQENELGSLSPGKYADFVILSDDIMTVSPPGILGTRVLATYLSGRRIYDGR